jgi:hypothetical protein
MASFTVRVELHQAEGIHYETLHAAMEGQGFSRLVTADDGRRFHLPWAEYDGIGNLTSQQVLGIAQAAANTTGKANSILVTEMKSRAWAGLNPVRT